MNPSRHSPRQKRSAGAPILIGALLACSVAALAPGVVARADDTGAPAPRAGPAIDPWRDAIAFEPPRLLKRVVPLYPFDARHAGVAGVVLVRARVGRDGRVREALVEQALPGLEEAAITAVRHYEFAPATRRGMEIDCWVLLAVRFDESLPTGGRVTDPIPVVPDSDATREFDGALAAARDSASVDSAGMAPFERAMRASLAFDMIPAPSTEAVRALLDGDSLAALPTPLAHAGARRAWARAVQLAPWWPELYQRVAVAAIGARDYGTAQRAADVWLAGRPGDSTAIALRQRAGQLRQAQAARAVRQNSYR